MSLEFPSLVRAGVFLFFMAFGRAENLVFAVLCSPIPKQGILNYISHGSIISVFTIIAKDC